MAKPNFFMIGAPKCGTTSLARWLSEHPQVFFSPVKEPHFFNTDAHRLNHLSLAGYERLFAKATAGHRAVGEGSTGYLRSTVAVRNLLEYNGEARLVVCLRNPVEMAYSLHNQRLVEGYEHVVDFETAWRLSPDRARGQAASRWCPWAQWLAYHEICRVGSQLERVLQLVPRERVLVLLFDDLQKNPRQLYLELLGYLGADDDGRTAFSLENPGAQVRSVWLQRASNLVGSAKRALRIRHGLGVLTALQRVNSRRMRRPSLRPEFRKELVTHFSGEVSKLEGLIGRDLSAWRQ